MIDAAGDLNQQVHLPTSSMVHSRRNDREVALINDHKQIRRTILKWMRYRKIWR